MLKNVCQKVFVDKELVPTNSTARGCPVAPPTFKEEMRYDIFCRWFMDFVRLNGLPNPSITKDGKVHYQLPSTLTKFAVWSSYTNHIGSETGILYKHDPYSYTRFLELWRKSFRGVKISGKKSDFCEKCNQFRNASPPMLEELAEHLRHVQQMALYVKVELRVSAYNSFDIGRSLFVTFFDASRTVLIASDMIFSRSVGLQSIVKAPWASGFFPL